MLYNRPSSIVRMLEIQMTDSLNTHYLSRKIHSLLGLIPVGTFLAFHLWENSMSRKGQEFFNMHVVEGIATLLNYKLIVEALLFGAILAHAVYGMVIWWQGKSNFSRYRYSANFRYYLQRITSLTTLAFIIWHVAHTRILASMDPAIEADFFGHMQRLFQNPLVVVLYMIGLAGATFHFANGLWLFGITWGITTHPRAQQLSLGVCGLIFLVTTALGFHSIWGFNHGFFA